MSLLSGINKSLKLFIFIVLLITPMFLFYRGQTMYAIMLLYLGIIFLILNVMDVLESRIMELEKKSMIFEVRLFKKVGGKNGKMPKM